MAAAAAAAAVLLVRKRVVDVPRTRSRDLESVILPSYNGNTVYTSTIRRRDSLPYA